MIEESKYCSDMMEKHFSKEFVMAKVDHEDFKNSTNCLICDNDYIDNDVKQEIIVISLEKIEVLHTEIFLNEITNLEIIASRIMDYVQVII